VTSASDAIVSDPLGLDPLTPDDAADMVVVLADERLQAFTGGSPPKLDELRGRYQRLASSRSADGLEESRNWIVRPRLAAKLTKSQPGFANEHR